jgi:hypothetical protein
MAIPYQKSRTDMWRRQLPQLSLKLEALDLGSRRKISSESMLPFVVAFITQSRQASYGKDTWLFTDVGFTAEVKPQLIDLFSKKGKGA